MSILNWIRGFWKNEPVSIRNDLKIHIKSNNRSRIKNQSLIEALNDAKDNIETQSNDAEFKKLSILARERKWESISSLKSNIVFDLCDDAKHLYLISGNMHCKCCYATIKIGCSTDICRVHRLTTFHE